jgi:hypothetical protein
VFGGINTDAPIDTNMDIIKYEPTAAGEVVTKLGTSLPTGLVDFCTVAVGEDVYLLGPYRNSLYPHWNAMTRFSTVTNQTRVVDVTDYSRLSKIGCAYVESSNRIYLIGGGLGSGALTDQISYIDLDDWTSYTTTTTSTTPKPSGAFRKQPAIIWIASIVFVLVLREFIK